MTTTRITAELKNKIRETVKVSIVFVSKYP